MNFLDQGSTHKEQDTLVEEPTFENKTTDKQKKEGCPLQGAPIEKASHAV